MNGSAHTVRRLSGFLVLAVTVGLVVMLFTPGAGEVADGLGKNCPRSMGGPSVQCEATDVVVVVVLALPLLLLIGLALIGSPLVVRQAAHDREPPD